MRHGIWLFSAVMLLAGVLAGQEITGDIRGVVKDPSGAVVSIAKVSIINSERSAIVRVVNTSSDGSYVAPNLPVGHYQIAVEASGFKKFVANNVVLNVNDHLIVDAQLEVGATGEVVNVEESPVAVNTETSESSGVLNGTQIRELSVLSRNFIQLVTLQPGVASDMATDQLYVGASNPTGFSNQINLAINGSRPSQNSFLIDGADDMQRGADLLLLAFPSIDSISEFKVERSNFLPEHGRTSSGEVSVVTRGGTNAFHGSAYEFFRNDYLNANNYFNNDTNPITPRPPMRWNDWGFTFGGPIQKDKTFFFYSQEWRHFITYTDFTSGELPSTAEMAGNFPFPVCVSRDSSGHCNSLSTSVTNIDPTAAAYLKDIYSKLPPINLQPDLLVSTNRNLYYYREESARVDHNFGQKVDVFVRYSDDSVPTTEPGGLFTGEPLPGVATTQSNEPAHILSAHMTASLSNTLVNDAGYSYSWGAITSTPIGTMALANSPDIKPTLPFTSNAGTVPFLSFDYPQGLFGFGPYHSYNTNHSISDTLSKTVANHSLKFGGVINYFTLDENSTNNASYYIDSSANCGLSSPAGCTTGGSTDPNGPDSTFEQNWANFLLGKVNTFTQSQFPLRDLISQKEFEFFAQDEFRVRRNFTLDFGLRYSLFQSPHSTNNIFSTFDARSYNAAAAPAVQGGIGGIDFGNVAGAAGYYVNPANTAQLPGLIQAGHNSPWGQALAPTQKKDFAPRFGFAWDPFSDHKTSVRGGYGIFYGTNSVDNQEYSQNTNPTFSPQSAFYLNTNLTDPTGPPAGPNTTTQPPFIYGPNPLAWKPPYTQQFDLDVQREVAHGTLLDIGYFGNLGRNLMGVVDVNMPHPLAFQNIPGYCSYYATTYGNTECYFHAFDYQSLNQIRPYQGYDAINLFSSVYTSSYNALQAQLQKHFTDNSQIVLNYTWSHDLTDASENFRGAQNTYNLKGDWGNSVFDRRNIFSGSYVYFVPFMQGQQGFAGHVLGGWELSGVVYLTSGRHYDPSMSSCDADFAGMGLCGNTWAGDRPDMISDPNVNAPHTVKEWFNTAAFVIPGCTVSNPRCTPTDPPIRPGDGHRGTIVGPPDYRWDASIFKNTKISERFTTQFRVEFFNALNHTNFAQGAPVSGMSTSRTSGLFGQILNARDPRNIQLALKLLF